MTDIYDAMLDGYDDVEPSSGYGEPLPTGWYPMRVEAVLDTSTSKNGAAMARLQLDVGEGPDKGKKAFVNVIMSPSLVDKTGATRGQAQLADANSVIQGQLKSLLKALGVQTGQPVGTGAEKLFSFYNVGAWKDREFMARIRLRPARGEYEASNDLGDYKPFADEKRGIAWWRGQQGGGGSAKAETI